MAVHIGKEIEKVAKNRGIGKREFGRRLGTSDTNIANIYTRQSIDTTQLIEIGKILEFDFLSLLRTPGVVSEPETPYGSLKECEKENIYLQKQYITVLQKLVHAQDKIITLEKLISDQNTEPKSKMQRTVYEEKAKTPPEKKQSYNFRKPGSLP
jgi:hypothetical protein